GSGLGSSNQTALRRFAQPPGEQAAGPARHIQQTKSPGLSKLARQPHPEEATADPFEREADRAAGTIAAGQSAAAARPLTGTRGADASPPGQVATALSSPGAPLAPHLRAYFEPRFGQDFSQVRVHVDTAAGYAARSIDARAFTFG